MLLSTLALSALLNAVSASPLFKRDGAATNSSVTATNSSTADKYLAFNFLSKELTPGPDFRALQVTIGSNNQTLLLKLDTTTSDFWVNSNVNEYCLAFYPVETYFNYTSDASDWNAFNSKLEASFEGAFEDLEGEENEEFLEDPAAATKDVKAFLGERRSALASLLAEQKTSIAEQVSEYVATATVDDGWSSFEAALPSQVNQIGQTPTANTADLAISDYATPSYVTAYSTTNSASYTYLAVSEDFDDDYSVYTFSNGDSDYAYATEYDTESGAVFTSNVGTLEKREDGWEKFTSGAEEFFGDLKKRDEVTSSAVAKPSHSGHASHSSYASKTSAVSSHSGHHSSYSVSSYTVASSSVAASSIQSSAYASATADLADEAEAVYFQAYEHEIFRDCELYGVFNDSASSSFQSDSEDLFASSDYSSFGFFGNDTVSVGSFSVNTTFGISDVSDSNIGILGLGQTNENSTFNSFPYVLAQNGDILKPLYSFAIGAFDSQITFGAVNFDNILGNLTLFPLLNDTDAIALTLSGVSISNSAYDDYEDDEDSDSNDTFPVAGGKALAIIDTTINNVLFPEDVLGAFVEALNSTFDVSYVEDIERYLIFVNTTDENATLPYDVSVVFEFQGTEYNIPLTSLSVPLANTTEFFNETSALYGDDDGKSFYYDDEDESDDSIWILSILPSDDDTFTLGLDFLTDNILVVVDLEEGEVGLAYLLSDAADYGEFVVIEDEIPGAIDTPLYEEYYGSDNVTQLYV